jgi:hypothetical protein
VACEFPREANIIEEIYAFLREFALSFECALVLDPPTKLDVGSIALRNIAVATNLFKPNKLAITFSPKAVQVNVTFSGLE